MAIVDLPDQEWQGVIQCMAYAPANMSVPLMNKIGVQVQKQQADRGLGDKINSGKSQEMPINIGEMGAKQ